jgi:Mannosylglycerate hydrolase MGH1-like glycoside hydrolase domain
MTISTGNVLDRLTDGARAILGASWIGASTLPSRTLYPHQWSWDSAFIAIGRSWYDESKARQELRSLFRAQWADLVHIVFNPSVAEDASRIDRSPRCGLNGIHSSRRGLEPGGADTTAGRGRPPSTSTVGGRR